MTTTAIGKRRTSAVLIPVRNSDILTERGTTMSILAHTLVTPPGRRPQRWLLVLHGLFGAGRNWRTVAGRLVQVRPEWGVILVDLRMHGDSQDFPPPHTLRTAAGDLAMLRNATGLRTAGVLGHSFGAK